MSTEDPVFKGFQVISYRGAYAWAYRMAKSHPVTPQYRNLVLYPAELPGHSGFSVSLFSRPDACQTYSQQVFRMYAVIETANLHVAAEIRRNSFGIICPETVYSNASRVRLRTLDPVCGINANASQSQLMPRFGGPERSPRRDRRGRRLYL